MTKTEAAAILADYVTVRARQRGLDTLDATVIAECISEAQHEKMPGSLLHQAGWIRPADGTIRRALRLVKPYPSRMVHALPEPTP